MRLQPTHKTAALAGAWSALGFVPFELWMNQRSPSLTMATNALWLLAFAVFLVIPVYFLVFGRHEPFQPTWFMHSCERARYAVMGKRMVVWFVSAGAVGAVWSGLLSLVLK